MNETPRDRLRTLSSFVYGETSGRDFFSRLLELADRERSGAGRRRPRSRSRLRTAAAEGLGFSERDCVLIAYGDSVLPSGEAERAGKPPLRTLREFLARRAADLFSYVHVLPFFPYSSDDGFSVIDYRTVDPALGAWEDIRAMAEEFDVVFDVVLNHNSARSATFAAFLAGTEPYSSWYLTRPPDYDSSSVVRPRTHPLLSEFSRQDGSSCYVWTTFSADQVDFDFANPAVLLEFLSVIAFYVRNGAGMLRLDAIAYLWKEDGTPCLHHPKTHAVVKLIRAFLEYLGEDVKVLTETNVPHADNVSYFGAGDEAHLVYNFALPPLVLHAAVSEDARPLKRWAESLEAPPPGCCFLNFLGSHDGIGLTPAAPLVDESDFAATIRKVVEKGGRVSYKAGPAGNVPYELNATYLSAVARLDASPGTNARIFLAAHAVMLSLSGIPALYFHSWVGSTNWSEGVALRGYNRAINRKKLPLDDLESELSVEGSLRKTVFDGLERLIRFRSARPAFHPAVSQSVLPTEDPVFALLRGPDAAGRYVLCASNFSGEGKSLRYGFSLCSGELTLSPFGTRWLEFDGDRVVSDLEL